MFHHWCLFKIYFFIEVCKPIRNKEKQNKGHTQFYPEFIAADTKN